MEEIELVAELQRLGASFAGEGQRLDGQLHGRIVSSRSREPISGKVS